tara:strand:- start:637 stop:819 length:183 start_codon:yes stop_codon:yes gene_type:complete
MSGKKRNPLYEPAKVMPSLEELKQQRRKRERMGKPKSPLRKPFNRKMNAKGSNYRPGKRK